MEPNNFANILNLFNQRAQNAFDAPDGWWHHVDPERCDNYFQYCVQVYSGLFYWAAKTNKTLYDFGVNVKIGDLQSLIDDIIELKFNLLLSIENSRAETFSSEHPAYLLTNHESMVRIDSNEEEDNMFIQIISFNKDMIDMVKKIIKFYSVVSNSAELFVISDHYGSLNLKPISQPLVKFEPNNYELQTANTFQSLVEEFSGANPYGRLAILHGPTGTGKTFMLRSFIGLCNNCRIIFCPPQILATVNSPSMTKLLLDNVIKDKPIILMVEDGDGVLLNRGMDNMNVLASLFNLTDGFLGTLMDIRVIITTNAKKLEIDKALMRPGRLNSIIDIGLLSPERAAEVYNRLTGKNDWKPDNNISLAEIYCKARQLLIR